MAERIKCFDPNSTRWEVVVVGSGPAGLALAVACAEVGLMTAVVDAAPGAPWPHTYGAWADEVPDAVMVDRPEVVAARWPVARVFLGGGRPEVTLPRAYVRFDNVALRRSLDARGERSGLRRVEGAVEAVEPSTEETLVRFRGGAALRVRVVVDATGSPGRFVRGPTSGARHYQTAFGVLAELRSGRPDGLVWMDLRDDHLRPDERDVATFLYAQPLPDGRVFLEETSLVRRDGVSMGLLEDRLQRRLAHLGITIARVDATERCVIPMDAPLPPRPETVVAYGSSAGMVHPATGFMVARALSLAPSVARALADGLERGGPRAATAAAWSCLWPADRVRAWELYRFGGSALATLDAPGTRAFFEAFFRLPHARSRGYLGGTLSPMDIAATMLNVFRSCPMPVRLALVGHATGGGFGALFRAAAA